VKIGFYTGLEQGTIGVCFHTASVPHITSWSMLSPT